MLISGLIVGVILGFVFQRGRFCVTGAFRDVWLSRSYRWITAFFLAIAIQAVLVNALAAADVIHPGVPEFAPLAVIGGSIVFGIGIVLAGGCATGTYYRSGEGLIGSWVALAFYMLSAAVFKYGIAGDFTKWARSKTLGAPTVYETLGISRWVLVILFVACVGWLLYRQSGKPSASVISLPARRTGLAHVLVEKKWSPNAAAIVVGIFAALAYPLSESTGRASGLGITTPSANIVQFLFTGDLELLDWGVLFVLGIIPGSYIAAKLSGEFRLRVPDAQTIIRAIWGGILMGSGASLAGGCSIGNSLVQTALFSWQGWVAILSTFIGVGIACKLFVQTHKSSPLEEITLAPLSESSTTTASTIRGEYLGGSARNFAEVSIAAERKLEN